MVVNGGKALLPCNDYVVIAGGTMNNQNITIGILAVYNADTSGQNTRSPG